MHMAFACCTHVCMAASAVFLPKWQAVASASTQHLICFSLELLVCREKLAALEAKHRSMLQDKNNLSLEKATIERELKVLRGQAAKFKQAGA